MVVVSHCNWCSFRRGVLWLIRYGYIWRYLACFDNWDIVNEIVFKLAVEIMLLLYGQHCAWWWLHRNALRYEGCCVRIRYQGQEQLTTPTDTLGCNNLFLPLIPAYGTPHILLIYKHKADQVFPRMSMQWISKIWKMSPDRRICAGNYKQPNNYFFFIKTWVTLTTVIYIYICLLRMV